jgi:hypothetical protein
MVYVRNGQIVHRPSGWQRVVAFLSAVVDFIVYFFKTIFDPSAAQELARKRNRHKPSFGGSGGGQGPGAPPPPRGPPRISGMSQLRDAGGNCAAGA